MSQKQLSFILLTKTINYSLFGFKTLFVLPINFYFATTFVKQDSGASLGLSILALLVYVFGILPVTFFGYWNKFCVNKQSLAYPYIINVVSWIHILSHFIAYSSAASKDITPYFCGFMFLLTLPIIYFNSPYHYFKNLVFDSFNSIIISLLLISFGSKILGMESNTVGQFFILIFSCLGTAFLLHQTQ